MGGITVSEPSPFNIKYEKIIFKMHRDRARGQAWGMMVQSPLPKFLLTSSMKRSLEVEHVAKHVKLLCTDSDDFKNVQIFKMYRGEAENYCEGPVLWKCTFILKINWKYSSKSLPGLLLFIGHFDNLYTSKLKTFCWWVLSKLGFCCQYLRKLKKSLSWGSILGFA